MFFFINYSLGPGASCYNFYSNSKSIFHNFFLLLLLTVRTPHAEYYVLCLFGEVCAATSKC